MAFTPAAAPLHALPAVVDPVVVETMPPVATPLDFEAAATDDSADAAAGSVEPVPV